MTAKSIISRSLPIRRGLRAEEAATYLSLSLTKFREMVKREEMPKPRIAGRCIIWDVEELDAAFRELPREGEVNQRVDTWRDLQAQQ